MNDPQVDGVAFAKLPGGQWYVVGDDGSVWSCCPRRKGCPPTKWRRLKPFPDANGYPTVRLKFDNGDYKPKSVHRCVIESFTGPCPVGKECAHENGNKNDARLCNLSWKTHIENCSDRYRHGTMIFGSDEVNAIFTPLMVEELFRLYHSGWSQQRIADLFGCDQVTVSLVLRGATYVREGQEAKAKLGISE